MNRWIMKGEMTEAEILEYWMSLIEDEETLEVWKDVIADGDPLRKVPEGFFAMFRPDGEGLRPFFQRVYRGNEILKRVLEIYEAILPGYDPCDWYFAVRSPRLASREAIEKIAACLQELVFSSKYVGTMEADLGPELFHKEPTHSFYICENRLLIMDYSGLWYACKVKDRQMIKPLQ